MIQVVVLQALVWYTLLLLLYEFRGAKMLICDQFCDNGGLIRSFKVDSDVVSLDGTEPLETHAEVMEDGKLCVQILRSPSRISWIPYPSSRNQSFRGSSFRQMEFSNFVNDKENGNGTGPYFGIKRACCVNGRPPSRVYPVPSEIGITAPSMVKPSNDEVDKNNQKIARSTSAPLPQGTTYTSKSANIKCNQDFGLVTHRKDCEDHKLEVISSDDAFSEHNLGDESPSLNKLASINETRPETDPKGELKRSTMPSAGVMLRLILVMVWRKLVRNPNTYSGLIALIWSFISFRWHIEMPKIIEGSINIVSNTGIGMATFSLGLFMASQPRIIVCGKAKAVMTVVIRFFVGPVVMGAVSAAIGIRGDLLRIAIIQAALPAAIVPFVFAKEYNVHPDILSTS
ncbi:hypothetical protein RND81_12G012300 [Saponaria officinalis]|uniref:Auxin efflux carrier component n=1 Tax=Saponaria officinalis TaxID=3572 RepID=A0AAW1H3Z1_SAPOF